MDLSQKDLAIILALEEDPLISLKELAEKTNISWPTVKKRYYEILEKGIIRKPTAVYNTEEMGLKRLNALAVTPNINSILQMEKVCDLHPYTHYRVRLYGGFFGLFIQFDIPDTSNAVKNLEFLFQELKSMKIIKNFYFYYSSGIRTESSPDFGKFNLNSLKWEFSWDDWFNFSNELITIKTDNIKKVNPDELTDVRLQILRKLTEDASIKQSELMTLFDLSRTEAHRHYNFVVENLIRTIRLSYSRESFDLSESFLIHIDSIDKAGKEMLYSKIINNPPPFRFALDILESEEILIWGNTSPGLISKFIFKLWEKYPNLQTYKILADDGGSGLYWFYPNNFIQESKKWNDTQSYMVDDVIKEL